MINLVKMKIKKLILEYCNNIKIDSKSNIWLLEKEHFRGSKEYNIIIKNSLISGNIEAKEGCKFLDTICSGKIKIGSFVSVNGPSTRISSRLFGIEIGNFTSIASNVIIQEDYHNFDKVSTYFMNHNIFKDEIDKDICSKGKITIEEDVWIGSNSVILSGVKIGRGSIIGAGSIVTKDIPKYSIVIGNPAEVKNKRFSEDIIEQLETSKWWEFDIKTLFEYKEVFNMPLSKLNNCRIFNL